MRRLLLSITLGTALLLTPLSAADRADSIRRTQQALKDKGFYKGSVDGIMGPRTRTALRNYQKQNNLQGDGRFTRETAEHLGALNTAEPPVAAHFENAGDEIADHYSKGAKSVAKGSRDMASDVKDGEITAGAKDFGKGVGRGAKQVGVGTKDAAVSSAHGTANAARVAADRTEDVGEAAWKKTKKGARVAADKTEDAGSAVVDGTKKAARKVVDVFDGKNEKDTKSRRP